MNLAIETPSIVWHTLLRKTQLFLLPGFLIFLNNVLFSVKINLEIKGEEQDNNLHSQMIDWYINVDRHWYINVDRLIHLYINKK